MKGLVKLFTCLVVFSATVCASYPIWDANTHYSFQQRVTYSGVNYECTVADVWYWPPTDTRYWIVAPAGSFVPDSGSDWAMFPAPSVCGVPSSSYVSSSVSGTIERLSYFGFPEKIDIVVSGPNTAQIRIEPYRYSVDALKRIMAMLLMAKEGDLPVTLYYDQRCVQAEGTSQRGIYKIFTGISID